MASQINTFDSLEVWRQKINLIIKYETHSR